MRVVALTGGIASGKSSVAEVLREHGLVVIDADEVARRVVEPGQPALDDVVARFGEGVLDADGRLDRAALGEVVFADRQARADLEAITHPRIWAEVGRRLDQARRDGAEVAVVEVPLLVEGSTAEGFDAVVVVAAPEEAQRERLLGQRGMDAEEAERRIAAQAPLQDKLDVATHVVWNDGGREQVRERAADLARRLLAGDGAGAGEERG